MVRRIRVLAHKNNLWYDPCWAVRDYSPVLACLTTCWASRWWKRNPRRPPVTSSSDCCSTMCIYSISSIWFLKKLTVRCLFKFSPKCELFLLAWVLTMLGLCHVWVGDSRRQASCRHCQDDLLRASQECGWLWGQSYHCWLIKTWSRGWSFEKFLGWVLQSVCRICRPRTCTNDRDRWVLWGPCNTIPGPFKLGT